MKVLGGVVAVIGAVVLILAGILGFAVFPNAVDNQIEKELRLTRGSDVWNKWSEIESPIYLNFYIFNVTNPDDVELGIAKPILQQVGPYAYRQRRQKLDAHSENCKDTVLYEQRITYTFDQRKSGSNREDDIVNIVNVAFVSVIDGIWHQFSENSPDLAPVMTKNVATAVQSTLYGTNETFIKRNVKAGDVTFNGWDAKDFCVNAFLELAVCSKPEFSGKRFGIYKGRNESTDGMYEVNTGTASADVFGQIKNWKYSNNLTFWKDDKHQCNKVRGSDGSLFTPFREEGDFIEIFNSDLCRVLKLDWAEERDIQDLKAYRYKPTAQELQGPVKNPNNDCYCHKEDPADCKDGTIDVSVCRGGSPILLSTPHYYNGDAGLRDQVEGLKPVAEEHETTIDIEKRTGLLLGAHKRIQVNLEVTLWPGADSMSGPRAPLPQYENLEGNMTFPVLWIDEEAALCDLDIDDFKSRIEKPIKTVNIVRWVGIAVGIVLLLVGVALVFLGFRRKSSKSV